MIDKALTFIEQELDNFLPTHFQSSENLAVLSNLRNMDGTCAVNTDHKIVLSFFNVEKQRTRSSTSDQPR